MCKEEEEEERKGGREGGREGEKEGVCVVVRAGVMVSTVLGSGGCSVGIGDMLVKERASVWKQKMEKKRRRLRQLGCLLLLPALSTLMVLC